MISYSAFLHVPWQTPLLINLHEQKPIHRRAIESTTDSLVPHPTATLGRAFDDFSTSYKLFWFRGLLEVLKQQWSQESDVSRTKPRSLAAQSVLREMVVAAWVPVCLFRLSLGTTDRLQLGCQNLLAHAGLSARASAQKIREALTSAAARTTALDTILTYVPTLFLAPWFTKEMRGISGGSARVRMAKKLARLRAEAPDRPPYWVDRSGTAQVIILDHRWEAFFRENITVVEAFVDQRLTAYLQAQNPNSPGIVRKLRLPRYRRLTQARFFWSKLRERLDAAGESNHFIDAYRGHPLGPSYSIDHFLPWSFVAHDQLWNLLPVETATNSSKGDALPAPNYIEPLAAFHWTAIVHMNDYPKALEDYETCFQQSIAELKHQGAPAFAHRYREILTPQLQIAANQGFPIDWRFNPT